MVKILHAADFHLDSPFRALSPELARARRSEARENLVRLANFANAQRVDLVLLAGDLFDSGEIYRETAETLVRALGSIHGRVFIAPGNHDYWCPGCAYDRVDWPERVHIFKSEQVESVDVPELNCVVHGAAFTAPECRNDVLRTFRAPQDGKTHLMVLHGDVDGAPRYRAMARGEIAESGLSYLALGHVHAFSGVQRLWNTTWAYPGCPEGRGFDECGQRGVILGTVDAAQCDLRFVSFARRHYEILTVDVTGQTPEAAWEAALADRATATDIYRIVLTGETDERGAEAERLCKAWEDRFYRLEVRDETTVARDVWARAGEDCLRGLFLQNLLRRRAAAENEEARAKIDRAARLGLAALDGRDL